MEKEEEIEEEESDTPIEQFCEATGEVVASDQIGWDWNFARLRQASNAHCPVIAGYSSVEMPVTADSISDLFKRLGEGQDISRYNMAVTAHTLCMSGF